VLKEIEAQTEDGDCIPVTLRRAMFGNVLLGKTKVLELRDLAKSAAADEAAAAKPSSTDQMADIVRDMFDMVDANELPARVVWAQVADEYGRKPNSIEKTEVCTLAGVRGSRGKPNLVRVHVAK
jgi:hypothetical protein